MSSIFVLYDYLAEPKMIAWSTDKDKLVKHMKKLEAPHKKYEKAIGAWSKKCGEFLKRNGKRQYSVIPNNLDFAAFNYAVAILQGRANGIYAWPYQDLIDEFIKDNPLPEYHPAKYYKLHVVEVAEQV